MPTCFKNNLFVKMYFTPCGVFKMDAQFDCSQVSLNVKNLVDFKKRLFGYFTPCCRASVTWF